MAVYNVPEFGESLSDIMVTHNLTIENVANIADVTIATVYLWKKGRDIKYSHLSRLARYLNCTIGYLAGNTQYVQTCIRPYTELGYRIRKIMRDRHISTYDMRQRGYGSRYFKQWDSGKDIRLSTLIELSRIFRCSLDYLVGQES